MLVTALLFLTTLFVAYANGANDNFKGVAVLLGTDRGTDLRLASFFPLS